MDTVGGNCIRMIDSLPPHKISAYLLDGNRLISDFIELMDSYNPWSSESERGWWKEQIYLHMEAVEYARKLLLIANNTWGEEFEKEHQEFRKKWRNAAITAEYIWHQSHQNSVDCGHPYENCKFCLNGGHAKYLEKPLEEALLL